MQRWIGPLVALLLAACGGAPNAQSAATPSTAPSAAPVPERLIVEGDDATRIVDPATGTITKTLPGGVLSPALDLIVSARGDAAKTAVLGTSLSGDPVLSVALPGEFRLPNAYGAAPSAFSPNGQWLVLVARDANTSRFAIVDVAHNKVASIVELSSRFTFDAIHNDGNAMYLIEHPKPGATSYNVRFYDLSQNVLKPDLIFDKGSITQYDPTVGLMDGTFHVSVAPKTGDWSFGLYMRPNGSPFVHALNVPGHYATCIVDLAGVWTKASRFSMTLADDGRYLYVIDAGMGTISVIDAQTQKVARRATFPGRSGDGDQNANAVISHDGTRIYAEGAHGIAMLATSDLSLKGWAAPDLAVRSLALTQDGARLYALANDAVSLIDPFTGRVTSLLASVPGARAIHLIAVP